MKLTISETSISHDTFIFETRFFNLYFVVFFCRGYIAALVLDLSQEADFQVPNCMLAINLKGCT
jgi:hypothetical protein